MKSVILLCAVSVGGPSFDKKGAIDGSTEKLLPPGSQAEFEDAEADRLIALAAARLPVAEGSAEAPVEPEAPKDPPVV